MFTNSPGGGGGGGGSVQIYPFMVYSNKVILPAIGDVSCMWLFDTHTHTHTKGPFMRLVGSALLTKFRLGSDESVNTSGPLNIMTSFQTSWQSASRWGMVTQWQLSSLRRVLPRSLLAAEWNISTRWVSENTALHEMVLKIIWFTCNIIAGVDLEWGLVCVWQDLRKG